jgi:hypothetical protein
MIRWLVAGGGEVTAWLSLLLPVLSGFGPNIPGVEQVLAFSTSCRLQHE